MKAREESGTAIDVKAPRPYIRTMLLETHCHTAEHSGCSTVKALDLVKQLYRRGLEGAIITDHHYLWAEEELRALERAAGAPDFFRLFPGQEVTTSDAGDVLVYGAGRVIPRGTPIGHVKSAYPDAAVVLAHPYRDGKQPTREWLLDPFFNAIEIFSSNHSVSENTRGLRDWHRYRFTATAGTDTHGATYAGIYPTVFDHPPETVAELADELKKGRCRPFFKEITRAGALVRVDEVAMGRLDDGKAGEKVIIKQFRNDDRWRSGERAIAVMQEIGRQGFDRGKYRVPRLIEDDRKEMTVVEQAIEGVSLFDQLTEGADRKQAAQAIRLAAGWLARLHNLRLQVTDPGEFLRTEPDRLSRYLVRFEEVRHRHTGRARETMEVVLRTELALFAGRTEQLVQGHGDYHPKNIFLCRDNRDDPATGYVAVIDFDSSYCLPPAFDVATFLVQFRNQFLDYPEVLQAFPEDVFLSEYLRSSRVVGKDFPKQVELFRARADLSIASFLIKMGLGDSENLWRLLVEAERALVHFEVHGTEQKAG